MIDREIRAYLRGATAAKVLRGWQGPHGAARTYQITPASGGCEEQSLEYTIGYVDALRYGGVEPLYRASEPL